MTLKNTLLGTAPETLSRIFNQFSADDLIELHGREIEVIDAERLENKKM